MFADMAELADALDLGSSGKPWGFKSLYPHQERVTALIVVVRFLYAGKTIII